MDRGQPGFADLLGVRSSKGRYYREYRHTAHDLERTLMAVNALSWLLADTAGDARYLVDSTLPVIAQLLGARTVVLVSEHPALGGHRVCLRAGHPESGGASRDGPRAGELLRRAELLVTDCPPSGVLRAVPELGCTLLLVPLPGTTGGDGYVVAAVDDSVRAGPTDLAILGTLSNQLAGSVESCRRLQSSELSRRAADAALQEQAEQALRLARRNELLKQARHDLVTAREQQALAQERHRIARDLHDSVAQHVLSMGMQVEWCRTTSTQPEVVARLAEVKELARSTVDRIRQAIFSLSGDDELQPGGLVGALRRLAEQQRVHGLVVSVRAVGDRDLPNPVQRALYMVAKEALFNTVLHAEAATARVHLVLGPRSAALTVSDDGVGRAADLRECLRQAHQPCADGYHRGLANVEARALQLGGSLTITDAARGGVRLRVRLDLDEDGT